MHNYNKLHKLWLNAHSAGSPTKFVRNQIVYKILTQLNAGNTLDVGCGTGEYSRFLAEQGHNVTAFDPSEFAIEKLKANDGRHQIQCEVNTIENYKNSKLFDNIISIEVIEHIKSDKKFAKTLYSFLKKKGSLVISAPGSQILFSEGDRISGHYRRYSYKEFKKILKDAGFVNIQIINYGFPVLFTYALICKFFIGKKLIRHFSDSKNIGSKKLAFITKYYPFIFRIDQISKVLWSVGYVAKCNK